jgi:hypothetical protein
MAEEMDKVTRLGAGIYNQVIPHFKSMYLATRQSLYAAAIKFADTQDLKALGEYQAQKTRLASLRSICQAIYDDRLLPITTRHTAVLAAELKVTETMPVAAEPPAVPPSEQPTTPAGPAPEGEAGKAILNGN